MRQSMRFVLLRNGFEYPTVAAASAEISVAYPNEPTGGHLALTGKQGCAIVGMHAMRMHACVHACMHAQVTTL